MVIFQKPNPPLLVGIFGLLLKTIIVKGIFHQIGLIVFTVAFIIWSYLEIVDGASIVRRILGTIVFIYIIYTLLIHLH